MTTVRVPAAEGRHFAPVSESTRGPSFLVIVQVALVLTGVGLRLRQYAFNRSLWNDEALIALNVIHKSYAGLTGKLDSLQAAPIGWLWIEKTSTELFGTGEMSLRLPEIIAGCLAVIGFAWLARRLLSPVGATVAIALFALAPPLVFFSSDAKPYGFDAAVAIGLLLLATRSEAPTWRDDLLFMGAAVVAVVLSYPAVFVVAALVVVRLFAAARSGDRRRVVILGSGALLALGVFVLQYTYSVRPTSNDPAMRTFWASGYAPRPLGVSSTLSWLGRASHLVARYPLEASVPLLFLLLLIAGAIAGVRRSGPLAWAVIGACGLMVAAAIDGKYPLRDRMSLFVVPLVFLLVGWAADLVRGYWAAGVMAGLALIAFAGTFPHDFDLIARPYRVQEYRQALAFAKSHARPGDAILTSYQADALDSYYMTRLHFITGDTFQLSTAGCSTPASSVQPIERARRVWLVFGNFMDIRPVPDDYLSAFRSIGHQDLWRTTSPGSGVALFTLNKTLPSAIRSAKGCITFAPHPGL